MLETVDADADRVTRLITELLDISRIDAGRLEVRRQPVDVAGRDRPAHRGAASPRARAAERFRLDASSGRCRRLWADPDKVDQVLANLRRERGAARRGHGHH